MTHPLPSDLDCSEGLLYCFSNWANTVTSGAFWMFALIAFAVAIFMATMRFGTKRAFGFAGFILLIGGVWLAILQFIAWWVASTFIIIGAIGLAIMFVSEK